MDEQKPAKEVIEILVTNGHFHVVEPRKPTNWYRAAIKTANGGKKNRLYVKTSGFKTDDEGDVQIEFQLPPEIKKIYEEAKKNGQEIKFILPPGGIPVFLGDDAIEKIEADKRKREKK